MYTIIMNNDKKLVASKRVDLYEGDNLADKIQFLFPQTYKDIDLGSCIVHLNYIDLAGVECSEILIKDEELYKNKLRYKFPIDSKFTMLYGDITFDISFSLETDGYFDLDVDAFFHTEQYTISIFPHLTSIPPTEIIPENAASKIIKEVSDLEERINEFEKDIEELDIIYIDRENGDIVVDDEDSDDDTVNVIDNLTSTSTTDALSANQGRILNEKKVDAPEIAKVGQILEVEEVDENGVPTKWKASDQWITSYKYLDRLQETNDHVLFCVDLDNPKYLTYMMPYKFVTIHIYKDGKKIAGAKTSLKYSTLRLIECNDSRVYLVADNGIGTLTGYFYYFNKNEWSKVIYTKPLDALEWDFLHLKNEREYIPTGDYNPATKKYVDALNDVIATAKSEAMTHAENKIAELVDSAPDAMNTIGELAIAFEENVEVVEILNTAITNKANSSDLTAHTSDTTIHVTTEEKSAWNVAETNAKTYTDEQVEVLQSLITAPVINPLSSIVQISEDGSKIYIVLDDISNADSCSGCLYYYDYTSSNISIYVNFGNYEHMVYFNSQDGIIKITKNNFTANINTLRRLVQISKLSANITIDSRYSRIDEVLTIGNTSEYTPIEDYHPATKKYVDDLGTTKISSPTTGEIGQVLVVEEIDENGHPVEWKTVDNSNNKPFIVTVTQTDASYVSDKTHAEILEAYNKGQTIYAMKDNCIYYLNAVINNSFRFREYTVTNGSITSGQIMINQFMVMYATSDFTKDKVGNTYNYENLNTEDKTLVGAINEIDAKFDAFINAEEVSY